jgi:hypothetical protein
MFWKAARGRWAKAEVRRFGQDLEAELARLRDGLLKGEYPVGRFERFVVHDPKERALRENGCPCQVAVAGPFTPGEGGRAKAHRVYDAKERALAARMVKVDAGRFAIVVNDAEAVYPVLIDPLTSVKTWNQSQSGAKFGFSLSTVGYIQSANDGGGVMVGAPYFDTASLTDAGKVFVYFGGSGSLPDVGSPTWSKEGDQAYCHFGWSVADAGDVNGGGYDDLIIGAPDYDSGNYDAGRAYIFTGSANGLSSSAFWTLSGTQASEKLGYSVAGIGNVNNGENPDYDDVAIAAPYYDYGTSDDGRVLIYHGGSSSLSYERVILGGSGAKCGFSLAWAGDVDADGYSDVIIGAPGAKSGGTAYGAAYVYYSTSSGLSGGSTTLWGAAANDQFGFSVAGAGDVDGDGSYDDVLVGAPYHDYDGNNADSGAASLFAGGANGVSTSAFFSVNCSQGGARLGYSVGGSPEYGHLSSQDYHDFIMGAPYYDTTSLSRTDNGEAWFYTGGSTPSKDETVIGGGNSDRNGWSVCLGRLRYHSNGLAIGAPDTSGGTVTAWEYTP